MDSIRRNNDMNQDIMRAKMRKNMDDVDQMNLSDQNYLFGNDIMNKHSNLMTNHMMATNTQTNGMVPADDQSINYYQEYCRLFIANVVLTTQMKELVAEKNELLAKLAKLEQKNTKDENDSIPNPNQESFDDKKKRFRRTACEIDRHYRCPVESCQKSYGSEGSLNQHVKLKHPNIAGSFDLKLKLSKKECLTNQNESQYWLIYCLSL